MKIVIAGENEREKIGAMLKAADAGKLSPDVLIAQARRGYFEEGGADKIFLLVRAISPATAKKIRRLIEREDERRRQNVCDHNSPVVGSNGLRDHAADTLSAAEINGDRDLAELKYDSVSHLTDATSDIVNFPAVDPLLQLKNDAERDGAWKALSYVFAETGRDGILIEAPFDPFSART